MMNKKTALLLVLTALMLSTIACGVTNLSYRAIDGNGIVVEESRELGSFNEIHLSGIGNVYVEYGAEESLIIEAEENLIKYIETKTYGNTLEIGFEDGISIDPTEDVIFYLTVVELEGVHISGLGSIYLPEVTADRFEIGISGAGDINIDALYADRISASLSGLGDVDIDGGEVSSQDVSISGAGSYDSEKMTSSEAEVKVSGLGSATVHAKDYLDASISGAGDINYSGSPALNVDVSGLGSLHALDD
ncbi:MAG: head GIN domain-containing protein [Chloroflexota bacterium]